MHDKTPKPPDDFGDKLLIRLMFVYLLPMGISYIGYLIAQQFPHGEQAGSVMGLGIVIAAIVMWVAHFKTRF